MIVVIDYGMGNLRSVTKAFELFTDDVKISSDPGFLANASGVILPGDGAFAQAMENLERDGWIEPLRQYLASDGYFMGICLGYQLLFSSSDEFGHTKGLDVIPGKVVRFSDNTLKVPHMGWNSASMARESKFFKSIPDGNYFYFIHSFYPVLEDDTWGIATTEYGIKFPCVVGKSNIIATQFHPEKSHNNGLKIIENFVNEVYCK